MKALPVGELKRHFSEVIDQVKSGEEVTVTYGKSREPVAVIIPFRKYAGKNVIKLGLLSDRRMIIHDDFSLTEEELLEL